MVIVLSLRAPRGSIGAHRGPQVDSGWSGKACECLQLCVCVCVCVCVCARAHAHIVPGRAPWILKGAETPPKKEALLWGFAAELGLVSCLCPSPWGPPVPGRLLLSPCLSLFLSLSLKVPKARSKI